MSIEVGDQAPAFELPSAPGQTVRLRDELEEGPVLLLFFPLAFSGVCTAEMCAVRDDWSRWSELGARVLGISVDSPFVSQSFREANDLPFPVLSDFNREVIRRYDVVEEDMHGLRGVAKRSAFVVDGDGTVVYRWVSKDADQMPPFEEIADALNETGGVRR